MLGISLSQEFLDSLGEGVADELLGDLFEDKVKKESVTIGSKKHLVLYPKEMKLEEIEEILKAEEIPYKMYQKRDIREENRQLEAENQLLRNEIQKLLAQIPDDVVKDFKL